MISSTYTGRGLPVGFVPDFLPIDAVYLDLSEYLDAVQERIGVSRELKEQICLTILEDDLIALIEECEELLIERDVIQDHLILALEARSATVMDEVDKVLGSTVVELRH